MADPATQTTDWAAEAAKYGGTYVPPQTNATATLGPYDTKLSPSEEQSFQQWKAVNAPKDSGVDYDLRGAYKAGVSPSASNGHWPDTYKKPNHPTFSNQSIYATPDAPHWMGNKLFSVDGKLIANENTPAPVSAPPTTDWAAEAAKYGGTYVPPVTNAKTPPPPVQAGPTGFWQNAAEMAKGVGEGLLAIPKQFAALSELVPGATDGNQLEKAKQMFIDPIAAQQQKARQEIDSGSRVIGPLRSIVGSVPVVGPMVADMAEGLADPKRSARTAGNIIGMIATPEVAKLPEAAKVAAKDLSAVDPEVTAVKVFKPSGANSDFTNHIDSVRRDINTHGGIPISGNEDLLKAAPAAKAVLQDALETWMDRARKNNVQVPMDSIVQATRKAISLASNVENPGEVTRIIDQMSDAYGGSKWSVDAVRQLLKDKNAELESFYDKNTGKKVAATTSGTPEAIVKAQRDAAAEALYNALDPENAGAGPRNIQARTGHITGLLDSATQQRNAIIGEKPISKLGAIGGLAKGVAKVVGSPVTADVEGAVGQLLHPVKGPSDPLIKRLFQGAGEADPIPLPPAPENPELRFSPPPLSSRYKSYSTSGSDIPATPTPPPPVGEQPPAPFKSAEAAAQVLANAPEYKPTARNSAATFTGSPLALQDINRPAPEPLPTTEPVGTLPKSAAESAKVLEPLMTPERAKEAATAIDAALREREKAASRGEKGVTVPETGIPENVARRQAAREEVAKQLGADWEQLSNSDRLAIDDLIDKGEAGSAQPSRKATPAPPIAQAGQTVQTGNGVRITTRPPVVARTAEQIAANIKAANEAQAAQPAKPISLGISGSGSDQAGASPVTPESATIPSNNEPAEPTRVGESGVGESPTVLAPRPPGNPVGTGKATVVNVPNEPDNNYDAEYELREAEDVHPSHDPFTFEENPHYQIRNERQYKNQVNQQHVLEQDGKVNHNLMVTDNPTATNGPAVIDSNGNVYGGNSRIMMLKRMYKNFKENAASYRQALMDKAAQYGLDPAQISGMREPILVRRLKSAVDSDKAVTDLNKSEIKALTESEQATSDARAMTPAVHSYITSILENAGDASLTEVLSSKSGPGIVHKLMDEGVFNKSDKAKFLDEDTGAVTGLAKDRISQMLIGDLFKNSDQLQNADSSIKNKLERIAGPITGLQDDPEWNIKPIIREAMNVIEFGKQHGISYYPETVAQGSMFHEPQKFSENAIKVAQAIKDFGPINLARAFREYVSDSQPGLMRNVDQQQAIDDAFGEALKLNPRSKAAPKAAKAKSKNGFTPAPPVFK